MLIDQCRPFNLKRLKASIENVIKLDIKSTGYVIEFYFVLVFENGMENDIVFTVSSTKWLENCEYMSKLKEILTKEKLYQI